MENLIVLKRSHRSRTCIGTDEDHDIIDVWESHVVPGDHDAKELARRLVASFNACKGIGTELLERFTVEDTLNEAYRNRVEVEQLKAQNAQLLEALREISEGEGAYSRDPITHLGNCLDNMKRIAINSIATQSPDTETP